MGAEELEKMTAQTRNASLSGKQHAIFDANNERTPNARLYFPLT